MASSNGISAVDFCRRLHGDVAFDATTPLLVIVASDCTRSERLEVLSAGAWETSTEPIDGEMLLLKLQRFMRLRRAVNRLNERSLVDAETGLYSVEGLIRRSHEVAAMARRRREPFAVVAIDTARDQAAPDGRGSDGRLDNVVSSLCRNNIRATDSLGRVRDHAFVWYAPDSGPEGAEAMIERVRTALDNISEKEGFSANFSAGFCVTRSLDAPPAGPVEMLFRALELAESASVGSTVGESL